MSTAEFFAANRQHLSELSVASGPIVIAANGLIQRNGDTLFPFRQDSNFYYLTGINEPDFVLVIDSANEYLIAPKRSVSREYFDGVLDHKALTKTSGIIEILDETNGWARLKASLVKSKNLATLAPAPSYEMRQGFYANPARARLIQKLKRLAPNVEVIDIRKNLIGMRTVKQPLEIELIQKAIDITTGGIEKITKGLSSYKCEYEIEAELTRYFRAKGASGHAFAPIVASGINACILHNVANNSKLASDSLVTLDVGAEIENYAADLTRTLALGRLSTRQKDVFNAVVETQNYALGLLKPGASLKEYERAVTGFLGKKLVELKLIISSSDMGGMRKYYPHATSHFLGLDAHDVGDYQKPLVENMILTCEPGIYITEEGIGVRIEDDVLITKSGNRVLSNDLPRKLC